jgi:hypothetical protein
MGSRLQSRENKNPKVKRGSIEQVRNLALRKKRESMPPVIFTASTFDRNNLSIDDARVRLETEDSNLIAVNYPSNEILIAVRDTNRMPSSMGENSILLGN